VTAIDSVSPTVRDPNQIQNPKNKYISSISNDQAIDHRSSMTNRSTIQVTINWLSVGGDYNRGRNEIGVDSLADVAMEVCCCDRGCDDSMQGGLLVRIAGVQLSRWCQRRGRGSTSFSSNCIGKTSERASAC
jgi:hypothetical protein